MNKFIKKFCAVGLISILAGSMIACGSSNTVRKAKKLLMERLRLNIGMVLEASLMKI